MGTTSFGVDEKQLSDYHPDVEKIREMEIVLSRCLPSFHRQAFRWMGNAADAEDVVQDALVSAYKHLGQFRGEARMSTWLMTIVMNSARVHLRRRPRQFQVSLDDYPEAEGHYSLLDRVPDRGPSPEDAFRSSEAREHLMQLMQKLPLTLRTAYQLRALEGLTIREISSSLGVTQSAVKSRVFRAQATLRGLARKLKLERSENATSGRFCDPKRDSSLRAFA
jgi:RNA polymerase sigma-70 factor (ECF subfamily)